MDRKLLRLLSGCLLFAVTLAAGCPPTNTPAVAERVECPHTYGDTSHGQPPQQLSVPGIITNVPEFHDCQRFIVKDAGGLRYDSLQAIFVRYQLDSATDTTPPVKLSAADTSSWAVATIAAFGPNPPLEAHLLVAGEVMSDGPYSPLGIEQRFNCIVLGWAEPPSPGRYVSWMVPVPKETDCARSPAELIIFGSAHLLMVRAYTPPGSVPPVSRWDWDDVHKLQYAGIYCKAGWCELHSKGPHDPSPEHGVDPRMAKGWYDEQYLAAVIGSGPTAKLTVDGAVGRVNPDRDLGGRTLDTYRSAHAWMHSATVTLDHPSPFYATSLNVKAPAAGKPGPVTSEVDLCYEDVGTTTCPGAAVLTSCAVSAPPAGSTPGTPNGTWFARTTGGDGSVAYHCVEFVHVDGPQAPGVVRWRWMAADETIWMSCPSGCCKVTPH